MTENDKPAVSFAEAVLLRPKMYTLGGTYEEVVAFLDGYFSGMAKANPYAPPVLQWVAFQQWLAVQLSVPSSDVFSTLKNAHYADQDALAEMLDWLSRFLSEQPATNNGNEE